MTYSLLWHFTCFRHTLPKGPIVFCHRVG